MCVDAGHGVYAANSFTALGTDSYSTQALSAAEGHAINGFGICTADFKIGCVVKSYFDRDGNFSSIITSHATTTALSVDGYSIEAIFSESEYGLHFAEVGVTIIGDLNNCNATDKFFLNIRVPKSLWGLKPQMKLV